VATGSKNKERNVILLPALCCADIHNHLHNRKDGDFLTGLVATGQAVMVLN